MTSTKLIYLEHMQKLESEAQVTDILQEPEKTVIFLDQTIFYPQGGGQPYDIGVLSSSNAQFLVDEVRYVDGSVAHKGRFEKGFFTVGDTVSLLVNVQRRNLNSRLHSAGHVIDKAISVLKLPWQPVKAYHFPDSPYVEYEGELITTEVEALQNKIQSYCTEYVNQNLLINCKFVSLEELHRLNAHVPSNFANLEKSKPIRTVIFDSFAIPCGGTHVKSLADIGSITITKIKKKGTAIRVNYTVS